VNELLANPAVQAGVVPALAGLIAAAALQRTRFLVLVPLVAFVAVVALAIGLSFEPMTTVRKVVVCTLVAGALALLLEGLEVAPSKALRAALALAAGAAALWVGARVLQQLEGAALVAKALLLAGFALALVSTFTRTGGDSLRGLVAAVVLGFNAGLLALLGASASQAFMGIGIGAASGAAALLLMARGQAVPAARYLLLPVLTFAALGPMVASLTGGLTFYALLPLLLVVPATALLKAPERPLWQQALLAGGPALVPMALSLALAWFRVGAASA
jgi:hypothetical protein